MDGRPEIDRNNALALQRFKHDSSDTLADCVEEVAALLNLDLARANITVQAVLDHYHLRTGAFPGWLSDEEFNIIIDITQPIRIPGMTERMNPILAKLKPDGGLRDVLDYGGGGGKDSIIFARSGYNVTYADIPGLFTPLVQKRFELRGLDISVQDVRRLDDNKRYDIINCMDVVEHVYDVEYITADLFARLRTGGHLLCQPTFANSWNGDHVEKNCGYRPYFTNVLLALGFEAMSPPREDWFSFAARRGVMPSRLQVYHLKKVTPCDGPISVEREAARTKLYQMSKRLSLQTMLWCATALPFAAAAHLAVCCTRHKGLMNISRRILDTNLDNIFDNFAINRLSRHRLSREQGPHGALFG